MSIKDLQTIIVEERAQRLLAFDKAYPDVGMGMSYSTAKADAISQLKREGILPPEYEE